MTPLQKFNQKDSIRVSAKIYQYFESFKKFICCDELPDFKIQYADGREDKSINYKAQIHLYSKPIILKYNIATLDENNEDFKATLVHEFTHLYDYYMQSRNHDDNFIQRNLYLYTEYHAVQIEILFCYHIVDRITDYAEIFKADINTWLEFPIKKNKIYMDFATKYFVNKSIQSFHSLKTAYMYACGASSMLGQLMNRNLKIVKFIKPYEEQMKKVTELLSTIKYNEVPSGELLKQIGDINAEIKFI